MALLSCQRHWNMQAALTLVLLCLIPLKPDAGAVHNLKIWIGACLCAALLPYKRLTVMLCGGCASVHAARQASIKQGKTLQLD